MSVADHIQKTLDNAIRQVGWAMQPVLPRQGDPGPSFSYTVGLHEQGLPELLLFALNYRLAYRLFGDLIALLKDRLKQGLPLAGELKLENWKASLYLVPIEKSLAIEYATQADIRSRGTASYIQVVLSDKEGRFPWDAGADPGLLEVQPVLGRPMQ